MKLQKLYVFIPGLLILMASGIFVERFAETKTQEMAKLPSARENPPLSKLDRHVVDLILLGQGELYDNFLLVWSIQYIEDPLLIRQDPKKTEQVLRRYADLNIRSAFFYRRACTFFLYKIHAAHHCEDLAKKGHAIIPDDPMIPTLLGYAYWEQEDYITGALWLDKAGRIEGGPKYAADSGVTKMFKAGVDPQTIKAKIAQTILEDEDNREILERLHIKLEQKYIAPKRILPNYNVPLPPSSP